jgi:transposase
VDSKDQRQACIIRTGQGEDITRHNINVGGNNIEELFVGIDISKDFFDVCIKDVRNNPLFADKRYEQNQNGFNKFDIDLKPFWKLSKGQMVFGMESTGIYHLNLYEHLRRNGIFPHVINPIEIDKKAKNRIRKTRTDKIAADIIAEKLITDARPEQQYILEPNLYGLREHCRILYRLRNEMNKCKVKVTRDLDILCYGYDKLFDNNLSPSSIAVMKLAFRKTRFLDVTETELVKEISPYYGRQRDAVEKAERLTTLFSTSEPPEYLKEPLLLELHLLINQYELLKTQMDRVKRKIEKSTSQLKTRIKSIIGIGDFTGGLILGELGDIRRFESSKKVVAFAGLDPVLKESGSSRREGHISKRGSPMLREALFLAAFPASKYNPVCKPLYDRLRAKGKHHNLCLTAVARKLLLIVYSVLKNDRDFYIPEHLNKTEK